MLGLLCSLFCLNTEQFLLSRFLTSNVRIGNQDFCIDERPTADITLEHVQWSFAVMISHVLLYSPGSHSTFVYKSRFGNSYHRNNSGWFGHEKTISCLTLTPTFFCNDVIKMADILNYMYIFNNYFCNNCFQTSICIQKYCWTQDY